MKLYWLFFISLSLLNCRSKIGAKVSKKSPPVAASKIDPTTKNNSAPSEKENKDKISKKSSPPQTSSINYSINPDDDTSDIVYDLPLVFVVDFSAPPDPKLITSNKISQSGTATGVSWQINKISEVRYELIAISVVTYGTIIPSIKENSVIGADGQMAQISGGSSDPVIEIANNVSANLSLASNFNSRFKTSGITKFVDAGEKAFMQSYNGLFVTDGSETGTKMIHPSGATILGIFQGRAIFLSSEEGDGNELWASDGENVEKLIDLSAGTGNTYATPDGFIADDNQAYILIKKDTKEYCLIKTYGIAATTEIVKCLGISLSSFGIRMFGFLGDKAVFTYVNGSFKQVVYLSDGTDAGTTQVLSDTSGEILSFGSKDYFFSPAGAFIFRGRLNGGTKERPLIIPLGGNSASEFGDLPVSEDIKKIKHVEGKSTWYLTDDYIYEADHSTGATTLRWQRAGFSPIDAYENNGFLYVFSSDPSMSLDAVNKQDWTRQELLTVDNYSKAFVMPNNKFVTLVAETSTPLVKSIFSIDGTTFTEIDTNPSGESRSDHIFPTGDKFYFQSSDGQDIELFVSDGTPAGTAKLKEIMPGDSLSSFPNKFASWGDKFLFLAHDAIGFNEPWVSDGTEEGTYKLKQLSTTLKAKSKSDFHKVGSKILFAADSIAEGGEFWEFNTGSGFTTQIGETLPNENGIQPDRCESIGTRFICIGTRTELGVKDALWGMDGTAGSIEILSDEAGNDGDGYVDSSSWLKTDSYLYFTASHTSISRTPAFRTDGTKAGTISLGAPTFLPDWDIYWGAIGDSVVMGDSYSTDLWVTDGTHPGTLDLGSTVNGVNEVIGWNGIFYVDGYDGSEGPVLYASNGTGGGGTFRLREFDSTNDDEFYLLGGAPAGKFLFVADDKATGLGSEIWVTDGTTPGTSMLKDIEVGVNGVGFVRHLLTTNTHAFLQIDGKLWATDGTPGGTVELLSDANIVDQLEVTAGKVLFSVKGSDNACSLYVSSGTIPSSSTILSSTILNTDVCPHNFILSSGNMYFFADTVGSGKEIWRTNIGTEATAIYLETIPGPDSLIGDDPKFFIDGNSMLFWARDKILGDNIWKHSITP